MVAFYKEQDTYQILALKNWVAKDLALQKGGLEKSTNISANQELKNVQIMKKVLNVTEKLKGLVRFAENREM